jgi:UDP-glucose 4-epimerase
VKVGITGGAGFLGTNIRELLYQKYPDLEITILDNLSKSTERGSFLERKETLINGDIRDKKTVRDLVYKSDIVIHLAADTRVIDSISDPIKNFEVNVIGSLNILEAARPKNPYLIFFSTGGAIIGEPKKMPITEEMAPLPLSPYGASKLAVEGYCSAYQRSYGQNCVNLRLSNVYGRYSERKESVISKLIQMLKKQEVISIYGDGNQIRDFVHASDIALAVSLAIEKRPSGVIQIASGHPTKINDLLDDLETITKTKLIRRYVEPRAGEIKETYCDISLAKSILNYTPKVSLLDGLKDTWNWYESKTER